MTIFVFISDGWGAVSGGINCFNYYLAIACAHAKRNDRYTKICCVVPDITTAQGEEMQQYGIIPITLSKEAFVSREAVELISDKIKENRELQHYYPDKCNIFCIGHDIYTGNLSKQLAKKCGGWDIVFHHMDYSSYYLLGKPNVPQYEDKTRQQKDILRNADLICAVGPMLLQSAQDISRGSHDDKCIEIFPGLAEFDVQKTPPNRFNPIVFGRVEKDNQAIKQIPLAIDAFATAILMDRDTPIIRNNPTLFVIGYDTADPDALTEEVERLQKNTYQIARRMCNVVPYPYTNDRAELSERLQDASVAMMLSFHEGFGLVGYEAIAAGIPLILSQNTGLYMFLEREGLDHLIYSVQITGSDTSEKYSQDDLNTVAKALRDIRQEEEKYKKNALKLRDILLLKQDKYSWNAVADNFMQNVLQRFEAGLKSTSTVFYSPEEVTKLNTELKDGEYTDIIFNPSSGKHVFMAKGKNALASLVTSLEAKYGNQYDIFIYNMQNGEDVGSVYLDFLNNCWSVFGKKDDIKGLGFGSILGKRLERTILILDNFPAEPISDFESLLFSLNRQSGDFYIFVVLQSDLLPQIQPYKSTDIRSCQGTMAKPEPIPAGLTDEQRLIVKILAFRGKMGYSKRLIEYICNGINTYGAGQEKNEYFMRFENPVKLENELEELGLIEEYSEYSYQNVETYLPAAAALEADDRIYAVGLAILGRFYAKCYYCSWSRNQQLGWGYFSCKCFASAAAMDDEIKSDIKADYEMILRRIRKKAMDTSDYGTYFNVLQKFIDEYEKPDEPWIWYALIHCEAICSPSEEALDKVNNVLRMEFPDTEKEKRKQNELYVQFIRLAAELENELGIASALEHLLDRIKALEEDNSSGIAWRQCLLTIINLAMDQKDYDLADEYLDQYRKAAKPDDIYSQMIILAMEIELKLDKHVAGNDVDLTDILSDIRHAYKISKYKLQDCRAEAWNVGLWGECQILLGDGIGDGNLRKAMNFRQLSGEKTKTYRNWLQRISTYPSLQPNTKEFIKQEMDRTGV